MSSMPPREIRRHCDESLGDSQRRRRRAKRTRQERLGNAVIILLCGAFFAGLVIALAYLPV